MLRFGIRTDLPLATGVIIYIEGLVNQAKK